jgi:hypothetical protein
MLSSLFPINSFTVADDIPTMKLVLVTNASIYEEYGFKDLGVYYTPSSLTVFHMPFIVTKKDGVSIEKKDLTGSIKNSDSNLEKHSPKYSYDILAENKEYLVVDYSMIIVASTDKFNVDFVPIIGDKEYTDFAWWSSDWEYCTTWWINNNYINAGLTNFPVLFNVSNTLASKCQADGGDIRFIDSTNTTEFAYEIELWNPAGTSYVWVNVTSVSSSAKTQVNMYYGYSLVVDGWNPTGVWDTSYLCVYHMNSTDTSLWDSTLNRIGTKAGSTTPTETTGQIGPAQDFEASNSADKIEATKLGALTQFTVEYWYNPESYGAVQELIENSADSGGGYSAAGFKISRRATDNIGLSISNGVDDWICDLTGSSTFNGKQFFAFTYLDETYAYGYMNTTQVASDTSVTGDMPNPTDAKLRIGDDLYTTGRWWADGILDEIRISNIVRSNAYLNASFHTSNMTIGFLSADGEASNPTLLSGPTNLTATTYSNGDIYLNWTKGTNATHTYIEYNTVSSWSRGSGTLLGNITGNYITHTDTVCGIKYYYLAWSFNSTTHLFSSPNSINNISCPGNPSSSTATLFNNIWLNITWVTALYTDATVFLRKTNSFPSSPTDGTILYNGTLTYYNDSNVQSNYYYRLYSWNNTVHRFSSGLNRGWGGLTINVYDENTSLSINHWDVFISNSDKTSTYESNNNSNPTTIDIALLPYGENSMVKINATNYDFKIYYMDLEVNTQYTLNAYLSNISSEPESYLLRVINEINYPVADVSVNIKRYINSSVGYQNVSILLTDSNGYISIQLIPGENYIVVLSKDGFLSATYDLNPVHIVYVEQQNFVFVIKYIETIPVTPIPIVFTATRTDTNISIYYYDEMSKTVNTTIYIYWINETGVKFLNYSFSSTSTNLITYNYNTNIDPNSDYEIIIFYNQTYYLNYTREVLLSKTPISPVSPGYIDVQTKFDLLMTIIVGSAGPFIWSNLVMFLFFAVAMFHTDKKDAGKYLIIIGGVFFFVAIITFNTTLTKVAGGILPSLFIVIGIMLEWRNSGRKT